MWFLKDECLERMTFRGERSLQAATVSLLDPLYAERNHQGIGNRLITPEGKAGLDFLGSPARRRAPCPRPQARSARCLPRQNRIWRRSKKKSSRAGPNFSPGFVARRLGSAGILPATAFKFCEATGGSLRYHG